MPLPKERHLGSERQAESGGHVDHRAPWQTGAWFRIIRIIPCVRLSPARSALLVRISFSFRVHYPTFRFRRGAGTRQIQRLFFRPSNRSLMLGGLRLALHDVLLP